MATPAASSHPVEAGALPDRIRHRFPIFERRLYINSCSQGALSDAVRAAYEAFPAWSAVDPDARARYLLRAAAIIRRRSCWKSTSTAWR